ncbi:hypothetical protein HXX76_007974 [Chlamydomonas incerta]|uniref:Protein kinase domain-containing protein n=1 Tax=Chlamydomonas incerta TaxID=51695 RepID=A0A835W256_CHLIN|nr:hypothetical protein HXX76_007974 [Chlamydomonas incerta]|eukprot:KAG2434249.1 hypothetical protein HXX76_007974 [Chlamydomonas incerta]
MFAASVSLVALFDVRRVYVSCSTGGAIPVSAGPNRWRWTRCAWTAAQMAAAAAQAGPGGGGGGGGKGMLVVPDTTQDPRFKQYAAGSPGIRFFCSVPLIGEDGRPLGTLGFVDVAPRPGFDAASAAAMSNFTALVVRHLEKRMALKAKEEDNELLKATYGQLQRTLDCFDHCVVLLDVSCEGWRVLHVNAAWAKMTGVERTVVVGQLLMDVFEGPDRTHLPSSALLHAADEEAELQIPGARLRLHSPLGTPKGGFLLTFRPAGGSQAEEAAEAAAKQQQAQAQGVLLGSTGAGENLASPFVAEPASGANAAATRAAASRFYFMKVDLAGRAPTSRASGGLPMAGSGFGAGVSDVVEGLTLSNLLGKGSFGSVYFGTWMGTPVAVKIMDNDLRATLATRGPVGGAAGQAVAEAILGTQLRHPNIVATLKWAARRLERPNANVVIRSNYADNGGEGGGSLGPSRAHLAAPPAGEVAAGEGPESEGAGGPLSGGGGAWAVMDFADHRLHELEDHVEEGEEGEEEEAVQEAVQEAEAGAHSGRGTHGGGARTGAGAGLQLGRSMLAANSSVGPGGMTGGPSPMLQSSVNDSAMLVTCGNNATGGNNITGGSNATGSSNTAAGGATAAGGPAVPSRTSLSRGASGVGGGGLSRLSGAPTSYGPSLTAGAVASESTPVLSPSSRTSTYTPLALGAAPPAATPERNRVSAVMLTSRMSAGSTRGGGGGSSTNVARAFAGGIATVGGARVSALGRAGQQDGNRASMDLDLTPGNGSVQTWIVMEYCDKGCLQDAIERGWLRTERSAVSGRPNMAAVLATAREVAAALAYLHSQNVVHGDLSGWNVMLCSAGAGGGAAATQGGRGFVAKVADFGLSRTLEIRSKMQTHSYGTLSHMPPELVMLGTMSRAVDVYSFGILLWQMYTGQRPWAGLTHSQIIMMIGSGTARLNFPAATPAAYEALMRDCTAPDPDRRPAFTDIVKRLEAQVADAQSQDLSGTF